MISLLPLNNCIVCQMQFFYLILVEVNLDDDLSTSNTTVQGVIAHYYDC